MILISIQKVLDEKRVRHANRERSVQSLNPLNGEGEFSRHSKMLLTY